MRLTNILYLFIIYVSSLSVVSCSTNVKNEEDRIITVSIEPLRYFTESVVGDKFKVVRMVPNGHSPATYEPSPEQMAGLASSTIYISVGNLGFDAAVGLTIHQKNIDTLASGRHFITSSASLV